MIFMSLTSLENNWNQLKIGFIFTKAWNREKLCFGVVSFLHKLETEKNYASEWFHFYTSLKQRENCAWCPLSVICWPDKSFLRTRPISLVSEDNLATNEQLSLSFSRYICFTNKCYEGVDPTLDPNAYLWS